MEFIRVVIGAFILDFIMGDPPWLPHPVRWIGALIHFLENKTGSVAAGAAKRRAGRRLWLTVIALTYLLTYALLEGISSLSPKAGLLAQVWLLSTTFSPRCLHQEAMKIYRRLKQSDLPAARAALSMIVGRDTQHLSEADITRAVVETVAENTVDGFLSPLFYALLGGVPLAMVYKAVNTMDSMLGYQNDTYRDLGRFAARADDFFNYLPARFSLLCYTGAALIAGHSVQDTWKIGWRDRRNHKSPNCAYPEAAMAGALGIELGGSHTYQNIRIDKPTIGDNRRSPRPEDIRLASRLMYEASGLGLVLLVGVSYLLKRAGGAL